MSAVTYSLGDFFSSEELIREAFERCGIFGDKYTVVEFQAGVRAAKLQLVQWSASQSMLYLTHREMIQFDKGQTFLNLPDYIARVLQVVRTNYKRLNTGGSPFTSQVGGTGNLGSIFQNGGGSYEQPNPNGSIGFEYNVPTQVWYVGIQVFETGIYKIDIEYSLVLTGSGDLLNWQVAKQTPQQTYYQNNIQWFVCEQPQQALMWRIREVGGSTLSLAQLFFCQPDPDNQDNQIGKMDRQSFLSLPLKMNPDATSSAYYFNEKEHKSLYIYGNSNASTQTFVYTAETYARDIAKLAELPQLALKYFDPLAAAVAYRLSLKYGLPSDRVQLLKADALETFSVIRDADKEDVNMHLELDMQSVWDL